MPQRELLAVACSRRRQVAEETAGTQSSQACYPVGGTPALYAPRRTPSDSAAQRAGEKPTCSRVSAKQHRKESCKAIATGKEDTQVLELVDKCRSVD